jgi:hypothetical protein
VRALLLADQALTARDIAWRFVACMEALPPDQAQPLWREAYERAAQAPPPPN